MEDEREEVESRFGHLLQPLRNLADNWSIDIASELEEYLNELESITFSFDGIGKSLNFAEAALLIQGSTIIYSKKVEYLYTLLYQTLDFLIEKKKKGQKKDGAPGDEDGGAADDVEDDFREQEAEFLTLDDMKEAENIDLDESGDNNRLRISLTRGVTPLALMTLNADEGTSDGTKKTDFRMNTCAVHSSGALLLEDERRLRDETFKAPAPPDHGPRGMSLGGDRLLDMGNPLVGNLDRSLDSSDDEDEDIDPEGKEKEKEGEEEKEKGKEKETEDEAERRKKEEEEEEEQNRQVLEIRGAEADKDKAKAGETDGLNKTDQEVVSGDKAARRKRNTRGNADMEEEDEDAIRERLFNLWTTMDPHSNQGMRPAPFKKGKTFRIPASLAGEKPVKGKGKAGKNATNAETKEEEDATTIAGSQKDEGATSEEGSGDIGNLFKVKGPYLPEFNYLYLKEMKRRVKERKKEKDLKSNKRRPSTVPTNIVVTEPAELEVEFVEEPDVLDAIERLAINSSVLEPSHVQAAIASTSGLPLPGLGLGDEADLSSDEDNMGWNAEPMAFDEEAVHRNAAAGPFNGADGFDVDDGQVIQSYEDLCRKHIENYLSSAEAFAIETSLTKRVADWRAKLEPILSRQEEAKPFDIHSYGESLITRFAAPDKERPISAFEQLVEKEDESSEVCRLFAATLQLANHGNVEIVPEVNYDDAVEDEDERMHIQGSFSLRLLSSTLVTFETHNNINIAVLKKKLGEGDESEEHQDLAATKKKTTTKKNPKRKRKQKKGAVVEEEEDGEDDGAEEDEMLLSEEDEAPLKPKRKGKKDAEEDQEEGEEVDGEEEEEEEEEVVSKPSKRGGKSSSSSSRGRSTRKPTAKGRKRGTPQA